MRVSRRMLQLVGVGAGLVLWPARSPAPTLLYWDTNGILTAGLGGGSGTWAATGITNWTSTLAGLLDVLLWNQSYTAVFIGTGLNSTVTVSTGVDADGIQTSGTTGSTWQFTGAALTLTGGAGLVADVQTRFDNVLAGTAGLAISGSSQVILNAANTYTGATTISGSVVVEIKNGATFGAVGSGNGTSISGTAQVLIPESLTLTEAFTLASSSAIKVTGSSTEAVLSGTVALSSGAGVQVVDSGGELTLSGVVSGSGGLSKTGAGVLALSGANTYSGTTTISNGTLKVLHDNALGATGSGNETVIGGGDLVFGGSGGFTRTTAESFTFNGTGAISVPFEMYATRSATLSGPITLTTIGRFKGGTFNDYGSASLTVSGVVSGANDVWVSGDVSFTGTHTFTGKAIVGKGADGKLTIPIFNDNSVAGPLGAGVGLQLGYDDGDDQNDGSVNYTGATASSNRTIQIGRGGTIGVSTSSSTLTLTGVISRASVAAATVDLQKTGPGALILRAINTFNGQTSLTNGKLIVGNASALGSSTTAIKVGTDATVYSDDLGLYLEPGITLTRNVDVWNENDDGGNTTLGLTAAGLAEFSGDIYLERGIDVSVPTGGELRFTGSVHDNVDLDPIVKKQGAGLAVFSNVNLSNGGFEVYAGDLRLNGTITVSDEVVVASGGKLTGTGNITATEGVTVQSGGTLSPGAGTAGTMTVNHLHLHSGSAIDWQLGSLSTVAGSFDRILVTTVNSSTDSFDFTSGAGLTINLSLLATSLQPGNADPNLNDVFWRTTQNWQIIDFSGPGSNSLTPGALNPFSLTYATWAGGAFSTFVGGGAGAFSTFDSGDVFLRFTPVPEPSTWMLLGGGTLMLAASRRLRRRR